MGQSGVVFMCGVFAPSDVCKHARPALATWAFELIKSAIPTQNPRIGALLLADRLLMQTLKAS
jgi:hypothetical protein